MQVIEVRNVNDALLRGVELLEVHGITRDSRNGPVRESECPVTTVYHRPQERVLFWEQRDANPFFHFMESLWMLGGRHDLDYVYQFNKGMKRYSDDGKTLWGAYGWRWREYWTDRANDQSLDQLSIIIKRLKEDPTDRRSVLQMWDPVSDLDRDGKDVPCNTTIYFKIDSDKRLQMTVCNRSNDIIWGAYGANAVHMSMLQEYMAGALRVPVGRYYQVSDNYHAYTEVFNKLVDKFSEIDAFDFFTMKNLIRANPYLTDHSNITYYPMVNSSIEDWDLDLLKFLGRTPFQKGIEYSEPFFSDVAVPIQDAWWHWKLDEQKEAILEIAKCEASDWRKACWEWFSRRMKNTEYTWSSND
jgi:thymidylate synthase